MGKGISSDAFSYLMFGFSATFGKDVTEQHWVSIFQNLSAEDITWRAPWIRPSFLLYNSLRDSLYQLPMDWHNWNSPFWVKNPFSEEMSPELEMAKHEFEREKAKLLRDISSFQEENYQLKIDVQIEKSRTEKVQKEAEITRKELSDLYLENKKLRSTIRNSGLGKSSAEWKEEISNIKGGMEFWKAEVKKEEEKAAQLRGKMRDVENVLQAHQQHLDDLLRALEEKSGQHDRDI
ncbi:hypothetical protein Goklo_024600, partial [Gossypium klotzschianum]|nr:hypothetical protein [Gossypium klotzschianum]